MIQNQIKNQKILEILALIFIILLASYFRFIGYNWDDYAHLHPDERYITMVADAIKWPEDLQTYLNPEISPLSPYNNQFNSYIYGTFPLFFVKYVAEFFEKGDYQNINLVGRILSGVVDIGNLLLVYFIGNLIYKKRLGLISALLYAVTVMPIQQSHFLTTDNYETFFVLLNFLLLIILIKTKSQKKSLVLSVLMGVTFGLALASKISASVYAVIIGIALFMRLIKNSTKQNFIKQASYVFVYGIIFSLVTYVVFRFAQPYAFATSNWLDLTPQPDFLKALNFQRSAIAGEVMFPPQYQWVNTPAFLFPFSNLLIWGLGIPLGISFLIGLCFFVYSQIYFLKTNYSFKRLVIPLTSPLLLAFIWIVFDFIYRGGSFVKTMRYFFAIIPFMVIFASFGIYQLKMLNVKFYKLALGTVFTLSFLWSFAFTSIYTRTTTRIAASDWIYENIPPSATVANEHWDDGIPFKANAVAPHSYNSLEIQVYNPDNDQKIQDLYSVLSQTDYVFVTSDRARKTIGELPEEFPYMVNYYKALDAGTIGFKKVKEVSSYPQILGFEINDSSAEEAFWVYDHPTVRIYEKQKDIEYTQFRDVLRGN